MKWLLVVMLVLVLVGCGTSAPQLDAQPQPEVTPRDYVQEEIDRRQAQKERREEERRQARLARAKATVIPEGVCDVGSARTAAYNGRFCGTFNGLLGEAEGGGFLVVLDSVREPESEKGAVVRMSEVLYTRLEGGGVMGRLMRDGPVVVVLLMPPDTGTIPTLVKLRVLD